MASCCSPRDYDRFFGKRFAQRLAKKYRKRGLDKTAREMADFLRGRGIEGATVLEIGGGVGEIEIELLKAGAARAENLELSPAYEEEAGTLAQEAGMGGRRPCAARARLQLSAAERALAYLLRCLQPRDAADGKRLSRLRPPGGRHARRARPPRPAADVRAPRSNLAGRRARARVVTEAASARAGRPRPCLTGGRRRELIEHFSITRQTWRRPNSCLKGSCGVPKLRFRLQVKGMGATEDQPACATRFVASEDYKGWSLYGAPWLQPVAISGKSDRRRTGANKLCSPRWGSRGCPMRG